MNAPLASDLATLSDQYFEHFQRSVTAETQEVWLRGIRLTEGMLGIIDPVDPDASVSSKLGALLSRELVELTPVEEVEVDVEREVFISRFTAGINAFFPEGLPNSRKAELFSTALIAQQKPNGRKEQREEVITARADLIEALIGKRYDNEETYHGVGIVDLFEAASWMRGLDDHQLDRTWSVDPKDVYSVNPQLLRYSHEQLKFSADRLVALSGASIDQILTKAQRGVYRYLNNSAKMAGDIEGLAKHDLLRHVQKRPDILNYPLDVLLKKEKEYVAMGIPLDAVRSSAKFYVYRTETIRDRIAAIDESLELFASHLSAEEVSHIRQIILARPRLIVDCGRPKIEGIRQLILDFGTPEQWNTTIRQNQSPKHDTDPIANLLMGFGRLPVAEVRAEMEELPGQNLFATVRSAYNRKRATKRR